MEGLIPMVYRSLKKNTTRRQYECLSSGTTQSYKIEGFYFKDDIDYHNSSQNNKYSEAEKADRISGMRNHQHRRSRSIHVAGFQRGDDDFIKPKLVRFGSLKLFFCGSGE